MDTFHGWLTNHLTLRSLLIGESQEITTPRVVGSLMHIFYGAGPESESQGDYKAEKRYMKIPHYFNSSNINRPSNILSGIF